MKKYILFIATIMLLGCTQEHTTYQCKKVSFVETFPKEIEANELVPVNIHLAGCVDLFSVDSLLICKIEEGEYFWNIYNLNTNKLMGNMLRKGHGKNEFLSMPTSEYPLITDSALYCAYWNSYVKEWECSNITQSLLQNKHVITHKKFFKTNDDILALYNFRDSSYFAIKDNLTLGRIRGILKNEQFKELTYLGNLNQAIAKEDINLLSATSCINLHQSRVAEACIRLNQLNLYSLKDKESMTICIGKSLQSIEEVEAIPQKLRRKYFGQIKSYPHFFAALYNGHLLSDYFNGKGNTSLLFFDWNGAPLTRINIPHQISSFFIYKGTLYLFSGESKKECLYKYKLTSDLKKILSL